METSATRERVSTQSTFRQRAVRLGKGMELLTPGQLTAFNLNTIDSHCEAFGIAASVRASPAMTGFRELVAGARMAVVEPSVKVVQGVAQPVRFNVICWPADCAAFAVDVLSHFEDVGRATKVPIDLAPVRQWVDGMDWTAVSRMICGVDLRPEVSESRLKLWVFANDEPGRMENPVQRALSMGNVPDAFRTLHIHPELLLGFEVRFDGITALKLYPDLLDAEGKDERTRDRVQRVLAAASLEIMKDAYQTHVYLDHRGSEPRLDLHLIDPERFVLARLRHPLAKQIHAVYAEVAMLDVVAAIPQRELSRACVENFTLYYLPACEMDVP